MEANTTTGSDLLASFCNTSTNYSGLEKVYEFTLNDAKTITINLSDLNEDLDVFLLNGNCKEDSCLASATKPATTDEFIIKSLDAGNYFIVVDGKNGVQGDFKLKLACLDNFSAMKLDNDAYVDLNWNIDKATCVPQDTGILIKLIDETNTTLFEQEFTTAALTPDVIAGTFRHYLGPAITRNYVIRVYNRLSNQRFVNPLMWVQPPLLPSQIFWRFLTMNIQNSIRIVWRNNSRLADHYRIIKGGQQIAKSNRWLYRNGYTRFFCRCLRPIKSKLLKKRLPVCLLVSKPIVPFSTKVITNNACQEKPTI